MVLSLSLSLLVDVISDVAVVHIYKSSKVLVSEREKVSRCLYSGFKIISKAQFAQLNFINRVISFATNM